MNPESTCWLAIEYINIISLEAIFWGVDVSIQLLQAVVETVLLEQVIYIWFVFAIM